MNRRDSGSFYWAANRNGGESIKESVGYNPWHGKVWECFSYGDCSVSLLDTIEQNVPGILQ